MNFRLTFWINHMFLTYILLFRASQSKKFEFLGDWDHCAAKYEVISAIEYISPEKIELIRSKILTFNDNDTKEYILSAVSDIFDDIEYDLINLSLFVGLFQPKASLQFPTKNKRAEVTNFGAYQFNTKNISLDMELEVFFKKMNQIFTVLPDDHHKIVEFIKYIVNNFDKYYNTIKDVPIFDDTEFIHPLPNLHDFIVVDGDILNPDRLIFVDAMVEYYKRYKIMKLYRKNENDYIRLQHADVLYNERYFVDDIDAGVVLFNYTRKEGPQFEPFDLTNFYTFSITRRNLINITAFCRINSTETLPIIKELFHLEKNNDQSILRFVPIFDIQNETELIIGTCFCLLKSFVTQRGAVEFIDDVLRGKDVKKSYEKHAPKIKYNNIVNNITIYAAERTEMELVVSYAEEKGIHSSEVMVNNQIIDEPLKHRLIKDFALREMDFLFKDAKEGLINISTDINEYNKNKSLKLKRCRPPIVLKDAYIRTFDGYNHIEILNAIREVCIGVIKDERTTYTEPICAFIGYEPNYTIEKSAKIHAGHLSSNSKKFFGINDVATMIFPFVIPFRLSQEEAVFVAEYVRKYYASKLIFGEYHLAIFSLMFYGDRHAKNIKKNFIVPAGPVVQVKPNSILKVYCLLDLAGTNLQSKLEILHMVESSRAIGLHLCLAHDIRASELPLDYFSTFKYSNNGVIEIDEIDHVVYDRNTWGVVRESNTFTLKTIASDCYSRHTKVFLNGHIIPTVNGYFPLASPPFKEGNLLFYHMTRKRLFYDDSLLVNYNLKKNENNIFFISDTIVNESIVNSISNNKHIKKVYVLVQDTLNVSNANIIPVPCFTHYEYTTLPLPYFSKASYIKLVLAPCLAPSSKLLVGDYILNIQSSLKDLFNIDSKNASIIATEIRKTKENRKSPLYSNREYNRRYWRPVHNSSTFIIISEYFADQNSSSYIDKIIRRHTLHSVFFNRDDVLSESQLFVQFLTLSESRRRSPAIEL